MSKQGVYQNFKNSLIFQSFLDTYIRGTLGSACLNCIELILRTQVEYSVLRTIRVRLNYSNEVELLDWSPTRMKPNDSNEVFSSLGA